MRLSIVKSPNAKQFYIIESFTTKTGKRTSRIVEKLGNENEVIKKANGEDPVVWAKRYIDNLNKAEKENNRKILFEKSSSKIIEKNKQNLFNCCYIFL